MYMQHHLQFELIRVLFIQKIFFKFFFSNYDSVLITETW